MARAAFLALSGLIAPASGFWTDGVAVGKYTSFRHSNTFGTPEGTVPEVWAIGRNNYGQLGIQESSPSCWAEVSLSLEEGEEVRQVVAGAFHSLFLTNNGRLFGAGRNNKGQLGAGGDQVPGTRVVYTSVRSVAAGYAHTLISTGSGVYAMGWNAQGQLGTDDAQDRSEPTLVFDQDTFGTTPFGIAAGHDFSFIVAQDQTLYAFGNNLQGQLGRGNRVTQYRPIQVPLPSGVIVQYVVAGDAHAIFETVDLTGMGSSRLLGTGSNYAGQLSNAIALGESTHTPVELNATGSGPARSRAAGSSTCEVRGGRMDCTGDNRFGQLGLESTESVAQTFTNVLELQNEWTSTEAVVGEYHSLFFQQNNDFDDNTSTGDNLKYVWATGDNQYGQLGDCTMASRNFWQIAWASYENFTTTEPVVPTPAPVVPTPAPVAPTPAPVDAPTPAPEITTTRNINTGETDNSALLYGGGGVAAAIILFLCCRSSGGGDAQEGGDAEDFGVVRDGGDVEAPIVAPASAQGGGGGGLQVPSHAETEMTGKGSLQVPENSMVPTVSMQDLEAQEEARAVMLIKQMYEEKNPAELGNVTVLLQNNKGSKVNFYKKACQKYGVEPEEFESEKQATLAGEYIRELYKEKNPEKLGEVEGILQRYTGLSRVQFYRRACDKYGEAPKPLRIA